MGAKSKLKLINIFNKFSQLFHFLNEYNDLKDLWMTTKDLWNIDEHRLLCYLKLNASKSRAYMESEDFRTFVISRVSNPNKQISLNLRNCHRITDVSSLGNVHT